MRILVLTADLPPHVWSGVGTAVGYELQALAIAGADLQVLTTATDAWVENVRITRLNGRRFPAKLRGADVVHLHSLRLADVAWEVTRRDGAALVYTAHALMERELGAEERARPWKLAQGRLMEEA